MTAKRVALLSVVGVSLIGVAFAVARESERESFDEAPSQQYDECDIMARHVERLFLSEVERELGADVREGFRDNSDDLRRKLFRKCVDEEWSPAKIRCKREASTTDASRECIG